MTITKEDIRNIDTNEATEIVGRLRSIVESMGFSDPGDLNKWQTLLNHAAGEMTSLADILLLEPPSAPKEEDLSPPPLLMDDEIRGSLPGLQRMVQSFVEGVVTGDQMKDPEHYIFDATIKMFYGPNFWDWYNKVTP